MADHPRLRLLVASALTLLTASGAACTSGPAGPGPAGSGPAGTGSNGTAVLPGTDTRQARIEVAAQGYLFGSPLVITRREMSVFAGNGPMNVLVRAPNLATPRTKAVVAPNRDTLYLVASLDLTTQPQILTVPEVHDRYYEIQLIDAYTDVHHYLGTRATGGRAGTYALVAPGWAGAIPAGIERVELTTPQGVLLGRVRAADESDLPRAHELQLATTLEPLDVHLGDPAPQPAPRLAPAPGSPQAVGDAGLAFWDELGTALAANPPTTPFQRQLVDQLAGLGVGPGRAPSTELVDPDARAVLEEGMTVARSRLAAARDAALAGDGSWRVRHDLGTYGDDLLLRAAVAQIGWGANEAAEALYPSSATDADGAPYDGSRTYVIHFPPGGLPPVKPLGFWSITVYTPDRFLVDNPIDRYAIGGDTPGLARNPDGSLDVYLQHEPPVGREGNWLPTPAGRFELAMRLYLPDGAALDGSYPYPPVRPTA